MLLRIFSPVETISLKIRERPLSWHAKCSLPVCVRGSEQKCRLLKLANDRKATEIKCSLESFLHDWNEIFETSFQLLFSHLATWLG